MKKNKKPIGILFKILEWIVFAVLILILISVISPNLPTKKYLSTFIVASGSMEPTIKTGSVALVRPVNYHEVKQGDIVIFTSPTNSNEKILHRINQVINDNGNTYFITKGDNNNAPDSWQVPAMLVQDTFITSIPYLGYPAEFVKKPLGFGLLIGIPALLLIILEIRQIKAGIEEEVQRRTEKILKEKVPQNGSKKLLNVILFMLLLNAFALLRVNDKVHALFTTAVSINGISLSIADFTKPALGDVVINEVMWMGSTEFTADEWIELYNTTDKEIDISNWRIDNAVKGKGGHLEIPRGHTIGARKYFLIANKYESDPKTNLNAHVDLRATEISLNNDYDDNGPLILKDDGGNIIDQTPDTGLSTWPGGVNGDQKKSMERNDDPSTGWHTCYAEGCRNTTFWDFVGNNYGTPGLFNLSNGDPTETSLNFYLNPDRQSVGFEITGAGLLLFDTAEYLITYDSDQTMQGITGTKMISGADKIEESNLILGSCSSGGTCVYNSGVKKIDLKVTLHKTGEDGTSDKILEQKI